MSFDVKSPFPQVHADEAVTVLEEKHQPPEYFRMLTKHYLNNTYFDYNGQRYKQIEGSLMGSPLSPIIVNIVGDCFEQKALTTTSKKPKLWLQYVDDTFVIGTHGR